MKLQKRPLHLPKTVMPEVDRAAASRAAVAARRARADIKSDITNGRRSPVDVAAVAFADASTAEAGIRVTEFLKSLPSVGETKLAAVMSELGISVRKRLGGLGRDQRKRVAAFLNDYVRRRNVENDAKLIVLAGPAGVGKGTIARTIVDRHPHVRLSVSATTRSPRPGETDGVSYFFVSHEDFDQLIVGENLLEWATVHGHNKYGTPRKPVVEALEAGHPVLLEIDIQGARQIKQAMPEARLVFIAPPSWEELVRRLEGRGTETVEEQARRLATADVELAAQSEFDVRVINDDVERAVQLVVDLMGLNKELLS